MVKRRDAPELEKGGGSRAAKKRAKKKEKQLKVQNTVDAVDADDNTEKKDIVGNTKTLDHHKDSKSSSGIKKGKKSQLPFGDEDDSEDNTKGKTTKEIENDDISDSNSDVDDRENDWEDKLLEEQFSQLTPAEILFPVKFFDKSIQDAELDPVSILNSLTTEKRANLLFKSIIDPSGLSRESFYKHYWEKKPLLISNSKNLAEPDSDGRIFGEDLYLDKEAKQLYERRFDGFLSEKGIKAMINDRPMKYGKDVNVTNYCNIGSGEKRRITLDQLPDTNGDIDGEFEFVTAESNDVWSNFNSGCTIRLLCPQVRYCLLIYKLNFNFSNNAISFAEV